MPYKHIPVMLNEVIQFLNCKPGKIYVDCTLGGSGHSMAILEKITPDGVLIGIDQDKDAIANAKKVLKPYSFNVRLFHDNFVHLPSILAKLSIAAVDGILLDLGISLQQLESSGRGFSFKRDEPLDMRMNSESSVTAENLVNTLREDLLSKILKEFGEERWAKRIAREIGKVRKKKPITSSRQLARIVSDTVPRRTSSRQRIHPATRVFMALRIAVNRELECLDSFMKNAVDYLNVGGRLCVLSFHSLEDRIVKHRMKDFEQGCNCPPKLPVCTCGTKQMARSLTKKVVRPTEEEIAVNPLARSAKLRAIERIL